MEIEFKKREWSAAYKTHGKYKNIKKLKIKGWKKLCYAHMKAGVASIRQSIV